MSFTGTARPWHHKVLLWPPHCESAHLPRRTRTHSSLNIVRYSCCLSRKLTAEQFQISFERKRRGRACHSLPRSDTQHHTKNSQLFFDLFLVWQQLSSRFSNKGAESHEAHLLLAALKLAIAAQSQQRHGLDDRPQAQRAVAVAMLLSDLSASGVPVDAHSIAAAMVIDAVAQGQIPTHVLHRELGMQVCVLVHEIQRVRAAPLSIQVYDEASSAAVREQCLTLCDVRAVLIEVVCRLDQLQNCQSADIAKQQVLALQVLQIFSPLGHALGLSVASARLEDLSFEILFGESYKRMRGWMHGEQDRWLAVLTCMKAQAQKALDNDAQLSKLAVRAYVSTRAKSSYSLMKKLLMLSGQFVALLESSSQIGSVLESCPTIILHPAFNGSLQTRSHSETLPVESLSFSADFSRGGKDIRETYDVLGMRVVIDSLTDEPIDDVKEYIACLRAEEILQELFCAVPERRKDYISAPKPNGYKSLHIAVEVPEAKVLEDYVREAPGLLEPGVDLQGKSGCGAAAGGSVDTMEIQIRTQGMHAAAERGNTSHTLYKSGVDMKQSARLHGWIEALMHELVQAFSASQASSRMERWASVPVAIGTGSTPSSPEYTQALTDLSSTLSTPSTTLPPSLTHGSGADLASVSMDDFSSHSLHSSSNSSIGSGSEVPRTRLLQNIPEAPGVSRPELTEVAVRQLFDHLDHDGDGEVSQEEIQKVLRDLGCKSAAAEAASVISTLTQQRSSQKDVGITYEDLLNFQRSCSRPNETPSTAPVALLPRPISWRVTPANTSDSDHSESDSICSASDTESEESSNSSNSASLQLEFRRAVHSANAIALRSTGESSQTQGPQQQAASANSLHPRSPEAAQVHAVHASYRDSSVHAWQLPAVQSVGLWGIPRNVLTAASQACSGMHLSRGLQRGRLSSAMHPHSSNASRSVSCSASTQSRPQCLWSSDYLSSVSSVHASMHAARMVVVAGAHSRKSRTATKTIDTAPDDTTGEENVDIDSLEAAAEASSSGEPPVEVDMTPETNTPSGSARSNGKSRPQNGRTSTTSSERSTSPSASTGGTISGDAAQPAAPSAAKSAAVKSGTVPRNKHSPKSDSNASQQATRVARQGSSTSTSSSTAQPAANPPKPRTPPPVKDTSRSSSPSESRSSAASQPEFQWADPRTSTWQVPLGDTSNTPPQRRLRNSSPSSSSGPLQGGFPATMSVNVDATPTPTPSNVHETLYTDDEADILRDEEQQSVLESIDLDQIPGGLGVEGWEATDIVSVASSISQQVRNASMYTLELDDSTSEHLDNVLGAVVYAEGVTALVIPARGPLVIGAQRYRGCDVVISEPRVSGRHVFFEMRESEAGNPQLTVTDMGSTNGVFLNGSRCKRWKPQVLRTGDLVHLSSEVARFRVGSLKQEGIREASTVSTLIDDLKAEKFFMSDRAWRENKLQRLALGCVLHPTSTLTKTALKNSGTPAVSLSLPKTSLKDVAVAAIPHAAWTTINRDRKVRDFLRKGQVPKTVEFLKRMAVNYPTDPRSWIFLAEIRMYHDRDYPAARVACRAAFEACSIARLQLQNIIDAGYHHEDMLHRLDLIWLHALMTAGLVEWQAKLYTPARRLFDAAIREARTCGILAMQFVAWTWADCELQQGRAAMAAEVLNRALKSCKTPALILLLAKVEMKSGKKARAKTRLERLSQRYPYSASVAFSHANACLENSTPMRALRILQALRVTLGDGDDIDASMHAALHACEARALVALGKTEQAVYQINDAVRKLKGNRLKPKDIQNHEWHPWLDLPDSRQARTLPHLVVQTYVRSAQYDFTWAEVEIARARLELASAVMYDDAGAAFTLAREVVASGKMQVPAHCTAAKAALEMIPEDSSYEVEASKHLVAGLRMDANDTEMLGVFSRWLEVQRDHEGAEAVQLFAQEIKRIGVSRVPADLQAPAHKRIDEFLWNPAKK